jgi:hypothetical protein
MAVAGIASAATSLIGGLIGGGQAKKRAREAAKERQSLNIELNRLENSRQAITNPYAGFTNLSSLAKDTSGALSNTFANLGVATKAAEMQIEEADIALASTLDTLRETGASAGGATALAQAALRSKQGVTASIEQQEVQNEKLRAEGEQNLQRLKMAEAQRIQGIQISEGERLQTGEAAGQQFMFGAREAREMQKLNRTAGLADNAAAAQMQANMDRSRALASGFAGAASGLISAGSAMATATPTRAADNAMPFSSNLTSAGPVSMPGANIQPVGLNIPVPFRG